MILLQSSNRYMCYTGNKINFGKAQIIKFHHCDRFEKSSDMESKKMKEIQQEKLLEGLKTSRNFLLSPVDFVIPLVETFLTTEMPVDEFKENYAKGMRNAIQQFRMLPQSEIEISKKVFKQEFIFADSLTDFSELDLTHKELKDKIYELIQNYLS